MREELYMNMDGTLELGFLKLIVVNTQDLMRVQKQGLQLFINKTVNFAKKMENKTSLLENLIHLANLSENFYLRRQLEKIQEIVKYEGNDMLLGEKLRKLL